MLISVPSNSISWLISMLHNIQEFHFLRIPFNSWRDSRRLLILYGLKVDGQQLSMIVWRFTDYHNIFWKRAAFTQKTMEFYLRVVMLYSNYLWRIAVPFFWQHNTVAQAWLVAVHSLWGKKMNLEKKFQFSISKIFPQN